MTVDFVIGFLIGEIFGIIMMALIVMCKDINEPPQLM